MSTPNPNKDDALFEALGKSKKKKKRKIIRTVIIIILIVAIVLVAGVSILRRQVRERFASSSVEVLSYEVTTGTISTVVSGSGTLSNVDTETVSVPSSVELKDVLVNYGDAVSEGDLLATVDMSTVRAAMAELQTQLDELDTQIGEAEGDTVSSSITAGVAGRVKRIYAEKSSDVASCMVDNGALAVISLDGFMAVDITTDALTAGDTVTVILSDGSEKSGTVEAVTGSTATILVTDNGPEFGEEVTVQADDGTQIGSGTLYIHNPLAVTGYAGTISAVNVSENQSVNASTRLFTLTDTGTSANYDTLLRTRGEAEAQLLELLKLQRSGGIAAPISGSIVSVNSSDTTAIATISPDVSMSVTISVDESDILSLELGQEADVTVSSVSEDSLTGTVTAIDTSAATGSYTAVITLDKISGMLPGMTASVDVRIEGVDDAIIIPVEALHQTANSAYVYTSYDEEAQEYSGIVNVTVGLSNNNYVEITSGLSVGDTVYYTESQSIADLFGGMGGFGGGGGFTGGGESGGFGGMTGEMPDFGGEMPDRGGQSGGFPGGRG